MALRQEEFTSLCDDVDLERDRALVERCQAGNSAAFGSLYARYYERLLRFCLRRLNDRHEAEDAAQEAFARAWKALPNFAGERRFYPWLTVIAGNICTDMLRRRSRSTPTEDLELSAFQPVGGAPAVTADEILLAEVDGELVHKALDRLSVRHRHVLDMREGSGWTYQQMADHDGVEIGTIETLLWRARQALKREFNVLAESKGAFAGALIGVGAFVRKGLLRVAHRTAALVPAGGGGGAFRNVVAGAAVTSAAVAAALITPHALSSPPSAGPPSPSTAAVAGPSISGPSLPAVPPGTGTRAGNHDALPGHDSLGGAGSGNGVGTVVGTINANAATGGAGGLSGAVGAPIEPLLGQLDHGAQPPAGAGGSSRLGAISGAPLPGLPSTAPAPLTQGLLGGAVSAISRTVAGTPGSSLTSPLLGALPPVVPTTTPDGLSRVGLPASSTASSTASGAASATSPTTTTTLPVLSTIGTIGHTVKGVLGWG